MFLVSGNSLKNRRALDTGFCLTSVKFLARSEELPTGSTHRQPRPLRIAKPLKVLSLTKDCSRQDLCAERTVITGFCKVRGCSHGWSWPSSSMSREKQPRDWAKGCCGPQGWA